MQFNLDDNLFNHQNKKWFSNNHNYRCQPIGIRVSRGGVSHITMPGHGFQINTL